MSNHDHLRRNIERLLRAIEPELKLSEDKRESISRLLAEEAAAISEINPVESPLKAGISKGKFLLTATAIFIIAGVLTTVILLKVHGPGSGQIVAGGQKQIDTIAKTAAKVEQDQKPSPQNLSSVGQSELSAYAQTESAIKEIFDMATAGDTDGLLAVLQDADFAEKVIAAFYLSKIADEAAISPLRLLSAQWYGSQTDNPFAAAADEIERRLADKEKPAVIEEHPAQTNN